jgi:hypothetical protein
MIARVYDKNPADGTAQLLDSYDMGYVVMIDARALNEIECILRRG